MWFCYKYHSKIADVDLFQEVKYYEKVNHIVAAIRFDGVCGE